MVPVQGETLGKYEILIENIINSLHKYLLSVYVLDTVNKAGNSAQDTINKTK